MPGSPARLRWGALLALMLTGAGASAQPSPATIPSCVAGSPPMAVGERRALLDDEDRAGFEAAVITRFRVLGESGFSTGQVLLVARPDGGWTFANLRAGRDGAPACFTATFSGEALGFTSQLVRKYFMGADRS